MTNRRVLFYIHGMAGGGAERVFALLASQLAKRGHLVIMVNDFSTVENTPYLDKTIRSIVIGRQHIRGIWRLSSVLKQEKPDVILAALGASNLKMAIARLLTGGRSALILTYHSKFAVERRPLGRLGYIVTPIISQFADWTVAVSRDLAAYLARRWWASVRTSCIHNPISVPLPRESLRGIAYWPLGRSSRSRSSGAGKRVSLVNTRLRKALTSSGTTNNFG